MLVVTNLEFLLDDSVLENFLLEYNCSGYSLEEFKELPEFEDFLESNEVEDCDIVVQATTYNVPNEVEDEVYSYLGSLSVDDSFLEKCEVINVSKFEYHISD